MVFSRFGRLEERRQKHRLVLALAGSVAIIIFIAVFGLKLLIGFSLFVDRIKGSPPTSQTTQRTVILPPTLDPLPAATNSASIRVTGVGKPSLTLIVYVNGTEAKKLTVPSKGTFSVGSLPIIEGQNTISAKLVDTKGNTSDLSNIISIMIKNKAPLLEVTSPSDNSSVQGDTNTVTVSGKTDDDVTVTVNDRMVVIKSDNTFTYAYPLNSGDNKLKIVAKDEAGNQTTIERSVKYQP
ncbi:hypothetical protein A2Z00_01645 [Candidatus Gottesmanbacteria bacterium RBG_13_45_10]|uniref:Bacterial Ig-like domain-containing protein n=1 Tax=Candidatus Gottesmanbacteria bacterium RBG_13_45_10 TaxID=1798370 RepID=A0A1F5ZEX8_9BACT|nr:MAG: hypothetical protein A2Z00_01645 [Candidatus Gottesmanbacteria bacterium RBG_13_45_10]